jgi:hypothetical protein
VTAGSITSSTLFAPAAVNRGARIKAAIGILLICCFAIRTVASWRSWGDLDHASGTWIAMATDVRDGILYRPIASELGFGGTRYAPLHPLIQGGLMKLGIDALVSGYLIGIASAALLAAGTFVLMRRLGAAPADALLMCCLLLCAHCLAVGVAGIRGDLLAAGLDICGVAAVAGSAISIAGILFVLALATKVTCIFGIVASLIWLSCTGRRRAAIQLALIWLAGAAAIAGMTQWASQGRAVGIFLACADGGGQMMTLLLAPLAMVNNAIHFDPIALAFGLLALLLLPGNIRRSSLPAILLLVTLAGTVAIFGTPGTNINHLIDLHAAVLVVLATRERAARLGGLARNLPLALACMGAVLCVQQAWRMQVESRRATVAAVLDDVARSPVTGPILSENPLLPIVANQRPYLLDAYMFRVLSTRQPSIASKMWDDMQSRRFAAVVIYDRHSFGPQFMDRLQTTYFLQDRQDDYEIYLPRPR